MKLYINANRTGYSPCQIQHTMTVGELIAALEEFAEDTPVFLKVTMTTSKHTLPNRQGGTL